MKEAWDKFMDIHWTLPWGNGGRGTPVYLWPFVGVAVVLLLAWGIDVTLIR